MPDPGISEQNQINLEANRPFELAFKQFGFIKVDKGIRNVDCHQF